MSLQLTILKVLNGQPDGRASLVDLKRYVAILVTSGPDWTARMKRLAAGAPQLDIFGQSLVHRSEHGWQITGAGRSFLAKIEAPAPAATIEPTIPAEVEPTLTLPQPSVLMVGPKRRKRRHRRRRAADLTRRSA